MIRSVSMEPQGQFFASGSDDGTVKSKLLIPTQTVFLVWGNMISGFFVKFGKSPLDDA